MTEKSSEWAEISPPTGLLKAGLISFSSILLAEMGDKTQLATLLLSARSHHPWLTLIGAATALISTTLIGVWAGTWVAKWCPPRLIKVVAGVGFISIGGVILWQAF